MSYDFKQFKEYIVDPTLKYLDLYSEKASILLLATMAQESAFGTYLVQIGGGPALGPYQMEPSTHMDIDCNFLDHRQKLRKKVMSLSSQLWEEMNFYYNSNLYAILPYATAMCRIHYLRVKEPLPDIHPVTMGSYWKKYYNTELGKGTVEEFVENWNKYIEPNWRK